MSMSFIILASSPQDNPWKISKHEWHGSSDKDVFVRTRHVWLTGLTFSYRFGNAARHLSQRTTPIWLKAFWTLARIWTSKSLIELLWPSSLALVLRYALVYQSCIVAMLTNGLVLVHFPLLATTRTATVDPVPRSWRGVDSSRQHSRTFQRIANKGGCKRYTFTTHNTRPCNPWTRHLQQHDPMPFFPPCQLTRHESYPLVYCTSDSWEIRTDQMEHSCPWKPKW